MNPVSRSVLYIEPLSKLAHVGPQLPVAVGLTGLVEARWRVFVIYDEPNELVHCELAVQVGHGAFNRPRNLPAARRLQSHTFCWSKCLELTKERIGKWFLIVVSL